MVDGYKELVQDDFAQVSESTAATVAEFTRSASGAWAFHEMVRSEGSTVTS